mmetsp:Transcript_14841/g.44021  ORF Transcript_14841/g.44021 Transcript_14841/m.44021 type:complete len:209 (-) Transcript_14841:1124-1750(-)
MGKIRVWRSISTTGTRRSYNQAIALLRPSRSSSVSKTSMPVCVKSDRPLKHECVKRWLSVQSCARNHCNVRSNSMNSAPPRNLLRNRRSRASKSLRRLRADSSSVSTRSTPSAAPLPTHKRALGESGPSSSYSLSLGCGAAGTPKAAPLKWITCSTPNSSGNCGHIKLPSGKMSSLSNCNLPVGRPRATKMVTLCCGRQSSGNRANAV